MDCWLGSRDPALVWQTTHGPMVWLKLVVNKHTLFQLTLFAETFENEMCISFIIGMNNEINESINILHWFVDTCDIVGHSFIIHPMTAGSWWTVMSVRQYWSAGHVESFDLSQVILSHMTKADQIIGFSLPVTRLYTYGLLYSATLHVTTVCGVRYPFSQLARLGKSRCATRVLNRLAPGLKTTVF